MRVLVGVDVCHAQAALLEGLNLRQRFPFNLVGHLLKGRSGIDIGEKSGQGVREVSFGRIGQVGNVADAGENRIAVDENDMAADMQCWRC